MSLLRDIQGDLIDEGKPLSAALRKCKVLASRLGNVQLQQWLLHEANGYPGDAELPSYRVLATHIKGHFSGPFGASIKNAPIPSLCLPEEIRPRHATPALRMSVAEIESLLQGSESGNMQLPVDPNWLNIFGRDVYDGYGCLAAWSEIPRNALSAILNVVRNRTLDFVLELERVDPKAGDTASDSSHRVGQQVQHIFNTTIIGGSANVVGEAANSTLLTGEVNTDFASLVKALSQLGITAPQTEELQRALASDAAEGKPKLGASTRSWVGKVAEGIFVAGVKLSTDVAAKVLSELIIRHTGSAGG